MPLHAEHSPSLVPSHGSSANNIRIDFGAPTVAMLMVLVGIIGACGVVMGLDIAERAQMEREFSKLDRQYRMVELKLDDWTVVAHRAGLQLSSDYTRGPQGNPDAQSFNIKQKGK